MLYKYVALNSHGKKVEGELESPTPTQLKKDLRAKKMILIKFTEKKGGGSGKKKTTGRFKRIKTKDIAVFTRSLSTMINAGVNLVRCLEILESQIENPKFRMIVAQISEDVKSGISLTNAFRKYPKQFDKLYISMIRAGETSGALDVVLMRIALALENAEEIKAKIKGAMIYPGIVFSTAMFVMFLMLAFVIPKFMLLFEGTGVEMPFLTRMVMAASDIASNYWYLFFIGAWLAMIGTKKILATSKGRRVFDTFMLKVPLLGTFIRKAAMARFTRTMSTLLESGVTILVAFDISSEVVGNVLIEDAISGAKESIKNGSSVFKPLADSGQFPRMVTDMMEVGEESGELSEILSKVADFAEMELTEAIRNLLSAFEPLIILFMAVGVGILIISMFLPLFKMSEMV